MALIVSNLNKTYGSQPALRSINFTLGNGVVALLGANGSGKSTLLRTLATLTQPDSGELTFEGLSYQQQQRQLRAQIGYLPQDFELPDTLTPRKFLKYLGSLRTGNVNSVLAALHLDSLADQPCYKLSGGQIRLVGIAQALLGTPRLLLLDELARGLDVSERERVLRVVSQHNCLTLISTHVPEDAENIAQMVIVLHQGRMLFCGSLDELRASAAGCVYELYTTQDKLPQYVSSLVISRVTPRDSQLLLRIIGPRPHNGGVSVTPSLEDAYLNLTRSVNEH